MTHATLTAYALRMILRGAAMPTLTIDIDTARDEEHLVARVAYWLALVEEATGHTAYAIECVPCDPYASGPRARAYSAEIDAANGRHAARALMLVPQGCPRTLDDRRIACETVFRAANGFVPSLANVHSEPRSTRAIGVVNCATLHGGEQPADGPGDPHYEVELVSGPVEATERGPEVTYHVWTHARECADLNHLAALEVGRYALNARVPASDIVAPLAELVTRALWALADVTGGEGLLGPIAQPEDVDQDDAARAATVRF